MARPTTYTTRRIDTKLRLRVDQRDLLEQRSAETGMSRNRLIEKALDDFLGLSQKGPRLQRTPADPTRSPATKPATRSAPRVRQIGKEAQAAAEAAAADRRIVTPIPKTKHRPRRKI